MAWKKRTFQVEDTEYEKAQKCMPIWETAGVHCARSIGGGEGAITQRSLSSFEWL